MTRNGFSLSYSHSQTIYSHSLPFPCITHVHYLQIEHNGFAPPPQKKEKKKWISQQNFFLQAVEYMQIRQITHKKNPGEVHFTPQLFLNVVKTMLFWPNAYCTYYRTLNYITLQTSMGINSHENQGHSHSHSHSHDWFTFIPIPMGFPFPLENPILMVISSLKAVY